MAAKNIDYECSLSSVRKKKNSKIIFVHLNFHYVKNKIKLLSDTVKEKHQCFDDIKD